MEFLHLSFRVDFFCAKPMLGSIRMAMKITRRFKAIRFLVDPYNEENVELLPERLMTVALSNLRILSEGGLLHHYIDGDCHPNRAQQTDKHIAQPQPVLLCMSHPNENLVRSTQRSSLPIGQISLCYTR